MRGSTTGIAATAALGALLALAGPATAHVTVSPEEAPADGYAKLDFGVPHGCEGSSTTVLRVQIPKTVPSATPQVHPGWEVTTKEGPKVPVELHGEEVTRGVSEIVWTARDAGPLPDGRLDVFGVSVKLPAGEAGDPVHFPAIQECERGETRWIQVAQPGESAEELEDPAPTVTLTASEGEHGADAAPEAEVAADDSNDEGPSTGLVIAALVLGGLGLLTGLAALVTARRRTP